MTAAVIVLGVFSTWVVWSQVGGARNRPSCTMERLVVNGRSFGRSPSHGCKFVDKNGHRHFIPECMK